MIWRWQTRNLQAAADGLCRGCTKRPRIGCRLVKADRNGGRVRGLATRGGRARPAEVDEIEVVGISYPEA